MEKLIFDREISDIANRTAKGYYNVADFARINEYIAYLSEELDLGLTTHTFVLGERIDKSKIQAIINNINAIREAWHVPTGTPSTPIASNWNYEKANDIEQIIQGLYDFAVSAKIDKLYSGTFRAGSQIKFRGK